MEVVLVLGPLLLAATAYGLGLARLWRRAGAGRGIAIWQAALFALGLLVLSASLLGPFHQLADRSLAAHMAQHMVLMAVVPPLLLSGAPVAALAHAAPRAARWLDRCCRAWLAAWSTLLAATTVHVLAMWIWHLPGLTTLALRDPGWHAVMHASFIAAGVLFWSTLAGTLRRERARLVGALAALVVVMMAMGLLGALLTFAPRPLYPAYAQVAAREGLDALADQQLAGLIMWVPAAVPYLAAAVMLVRTALHR